MNKGLTITVVFEAMSLNYGEGVGNISELKKLSRDGRTYSYLSRQAIRYDLYRSMKENFDMDKDLSEPLTKENKVVQFKSSTTIKDYIEADLFGYMKTVKDKGAVTRSAVVRLSPAVALEPYSGDMEFGTNKNFSDRTKADPNPFQFEHQKSLYSYTLTVDLDRAGNDPHDDIKIKNTEKTKRIHMLLDAVKVLNREIKGRIESLNPLFVIGGVYDVKNPFFMDRIEVSYDNNKKKYALNGEILKSVAELEFMGKKVLDQSNIGYVPGFFTDDGQFSEILGKDRTLSINEFFNTLKDGVRKYYESLKG
ncbi:MAG: type I-B CRISPR-associated protein Cas7/Cst2/DevR [Spirochaetales bacterium]|nr:type I-B CRISPR-associated protein Cas7/Cst2/DevR [Spirochaetales bacterium]